MLLGAFKVICKVFFSFLKYSGVLAILVHVAPILCLRSVFVCFLMSF
jgi:hypothetical protein